MMPLAVMLSFQGPGKQRREFAMLLGDAHDSQCHRAMVTADNRVNAVVQNPAFGHGLAPFGYALGIAGENV